MKCISNGSLNCTSLSGLLAGHSLTRLICHLSAWDIIPSPGLRDEVCREQIYRHPSEALRKNRNGSTEAESILVSIPCLTLLCGLAEITGVRSKPLSGFPLCKIRLMKAERLSDLPKLECTLSFRKLMCF